MVKTIGILIGELILSSVILIYIYPMTTMMLFGEASASSPLYSKGNLITWFLMPVLVPTLINLRVLRDARKRGDADKLKLFKLIQWVLIILYFPAVLWLYFNFDKL